MRITFITFTAAAALAICAVHAHADNSSRDIRTVGAYSLDDSIYVNTPDGKAARRITEGHPDFKPSWSPDGKWIVFFRIVNDKNLPIPKWRTKICVVSPDGKIVREITSGAFTDFNPTWTRDGKNSIIINRYDPDKNRGYIYLSSPDAKPGDEVLISDPAYSEFGHCGMKDGRIIVSTSNGSVFSYLFSSKENGLYSPPFMRVLTPEPGKTGRYEILRFDDKIKSLPNRVTLSPDETMITFEMDNSMGNFGYAGHPLVIASFDGSTPSVKNLTTFCFTPPNDFALYPAWTPDSKGIIYFAGSYGSKYQFYLYDVTAKRTTRIFADRSHEFKYFCGEASPK